MKAADKEFSSRRIIMKRILTAILFITLSLTGLAAASGRSGGDTASPKHQAAVSGDGQASDTVVDNDNGILIIDLRKAGRGTSSFPSSFFDDGSVTLVDLSREGHLITAESLRKNRRRGFSVIILDADPSIFTRHSVQCASASYRSRDYTTYMPIIQEAGERFGLDPQLIMTVIEVESGFNAQAESPCGAMGLMQIMPETAKGLNLKNPYDPYENIVAGVKYLKMQLDRFGSIDLALAAYNAGPGAVEKHGGVPPYQETQQYVKMILERYYGGPLRP